MSASHAASRHGGRPLAVRSACLRALPGFAIFVLATYALVQLGAGAHGTLVRNSLSISAGQPPTIAAPFHLLPAAAAFVSAHRLTAQMTSQQQAVAVAQVLVASHGAWTPIQADFARTLERITVHGEGYCADYSKVFAGLMHALAIPVREWGFGIGGFGAGHAFNEFYDLQTASWVFIDAINSFQVRDRISGRMLAVADLRQALRRPDYHERLQVLPIDPHHFAFDTTQRALDYYREQLNYFYVLDRPSIVGDDYYKLVAPLPRAIQVMGALAFGVQPGVVITRNGGDQIALQQLREIRSIFIALAGLVLVSGLNLIGAALGVRRALQAAGRSA